MLQWDDAKIYHMIVDEKLSIREVASRLDRSKSSVHKRIHSMEFWCNADITFGMIRDMLDQLDKNFHTKHIKGGAKTKKLYAEGRLKGLSVHYKSGIRR